MSGESVAWRLDPGERRLSITLPAALGGRTHEVALTGGYTFRPA
jgi:hypothetical protein